MSSCRFMSMNSSLTTVYRVLQLLPQEVFLKTQTYISVHTSTLDTVLLHSTLNVYLLLYGLYTWLSDTLTVVISVQYLYVFVNISVWYDDYGEPVRFVCLQCYVMFYFSWVTPKTHLSLKRNREVSLFFTVIIVLMKCTFTINFPTVALCGFSVLRCKKKC